MIRNSMALLEPTVSDHELNITCQKLENSIKDEMNRVQLKFRLNSLKSRYSSKFSPGISHPSIPDSSDDYKTEERYGPIEIDHKTSFAAMGEIFTHPQTTPLAVDSEISIAVTKRLHVVQSMAASSNQANGMGKSHKELHGRKDSLEMLLSRSKSLCNCLSKSVEESLGCPIEHLCLQEGFHHLISDLQEQLWILEAWTDHLRQELLGVERAGLDVHHLLLESNILIDKSEAISKSIGLLQSRIISSEDDILRKIESLRRELHEIQHDVRWVFDVHRMSEAKY
eukprot:jgi/Picre1/32591/NNA_007937.t1